MSVIRDHIEAPPEEEAVDVHLHAASPLREHRRHQQLDAVQLLRLVLRQILALEVGVDRHLDRAASAYRRDEIQSRAAPALTDQLNRLG